MRYESMRSRDTARRIRAGLFGLTLLASAGCADTLGVDPSQIQAQPGGSTATSPSSRIAYGISTSPPSPTYPAPVPRP
jgi:hypothetical protein